MTEETDRNACGANTEARIVSALRDIECDSREPNRAEVM